MLSGIYSALSGLFAFRTKIDVTAHNVANLDTDGFKKSRAVMEETPPGGVQARVQTVNTPGPRVLDPSSPGARFVEKSNVDIGEAMVDLITARRSYEANLETLKTENELLGSLLDTLDR